MMNVRPVPHLVEAWNEIVDDWRPHEGKPPGPEDRFHVETHVSQQRDVFLTADRSLLVMCRRLRSGDELPIVAMTVIEYLTSRTDRGLRPR
jgi:hypothetical protein